MIEYFTRAIVLDKEAVGELDSGVILYTQALGWISAKTKSARKIISKLNSHLEPLNIVDVRLVEKNGFQAADALRLSRLPESQLPILKLVKELTPKGDPDPELWSALLKEEDAKNKEEKILRILGFDPKFAVCGQCGRKESLRFSTADLNYYCGNCYY
jgi:recombinational DNA repair protein (RecF pathway)